MLETVLAVAMSPMPMHALADGNADPGKRLYDTHCLGRHGAGKTTGALGPSLAGIIRRKATGDSGVHSRALSEFGVTWNEVGLRAVLSRGTTRPVPGTTMPAGVPNPEQIDDLIAYLRTSR